MSHRLLCLFSLLLGAPMLAAAPRTDAPLRIHIRAGVKTHGPGQHDHPRFLEEWTRLLSQRGAQVSGGMEFPSAAELDATDVLLMYAADAGSIHAEERARFEHFVGRGGGLVVLHDAVCGDDPQWYKTIIGGAWEHGHSKWHEGEIGLYFRDREHPITRGASNFDLVDEIYWDLHLTQEAHVLADSFHTVFDVHPQMWVVEREFTPGVPYRAFVSLQGHEFSSFSHLAWRAMLLRGIAWAGGRDVSLLTSPEEVAAMRYPEGGPTAPELADRTFTHDAHFEVSLVASEPDLVNPISIDWDERERMWVACTPGYPYKEQFSGVPAHDRIMILEDADRDGRAEHSQLFHEGLDLVTSLVLHGDGVIVTTAPEIQWLRDRDGDQRCDEVVTLYSGFGFGDTHAVMSNMRWGMDGWIYATQGYSGGASRHVLGHTSAGTHDFGHIGNGLFRFRPDGSAIEMVSSYGSNTWGLDFTWDGELFFTMANGAHLRHVVLPEAVLARGRVGTTPSWADAPDHQRAFPTSRHERSPYVQIDFVGGFTAAAGSLIYSGGAWPSEYDGNHFVCEPTLNIVHRDFLHSNGPSFGASKPREAEFLAATDLWFRPVHLRSGPDGALYVLDFYNQAAVHNDTRGPQHGPTNAAIRPDRDFQHGRIWRMQHDEARPEPRRSFATTDECLAALSDPNRWARMTAQRLLSESEDASEWQERVTAMIGDASLPTAARVHALYLHMSRQPDDVAAALAGLRDADVAVRKNAAWIVEGLDLSGQAAHGGLAHEHIEVDKDLLANLGQALLAEVEQPDDRLRLAALAALGSLPPSDEIRAALIPSLMIPQDEWTRSALLGVALVDPRSFLVHMSLVGEGPQAAELVGTLTRRLASSFGAKEALKLLGNVVSMGRVQPAMVAAEVRELASSLPSDAHGVWDAEVEEALTLLLTSDDLTVATSSAPLVAYWDTEGRLDQTVERMAGRLMATLGDADSTWDTCLDSLQILLQLPSHRGRAIEASSWMLAPEQPLDMQERAIALFGSCGERVAGDALIANLRGMTSSARAVAFPQILRRPEWCLALIDQVAAGELTRIDLGPQRSFQLVEHPDQEVSARAREVLSSSNADKDALIAKLLPIVTQPGDVERGRKLFGEQCAICHSLDGEGAAVGPPLDGMGAHGPAELLPFVVDPNRSVESNFLEYAARTTEGLTVSGVVVMDTSDRVVLRSSNGEASLARDEIEQIWSLGRSPMPEGLDELGGEALRDILAYVCRDYGGWRIVDISGATTVSTTVGLYDRREPVTYEFVKRGVVEVDGIPFEILDPGRTKNARDVITLKGALAKNWDSWTLRPRRVEIPVGYALSEMHVLGGVAAWGYPYTRERAPAVRWTWVYADGEREELILKDGEYFADWIARNDVPASKFVSGVLQPGTRGQLRRFSLRPSRAVPVESIVLESFENHLSATFLALTARTAEPVDELYVPAPEPSEAAPKSAPVLMLGGGSSHDFERWFAGEDVATLGAAGLGEVLYTDELSSLAERLADTRLLILSNNQPIAASERAAIEQHVAAKKGLLIVHAATWYNWTDWPEWNARYVGGGARSHEALAEFEVLVQGGAHQLCRGLPASFRVTDELYRFETAPDAAPIEVLAVGRSLATGAQYPVLWTVQSAAGPIVVTTLGHDGSAHRHPAYQRLLLNAARWLTR